MVARLSSHEEWAFEEFGSAKLGRIDRTRRLVKMAAQFADRPGAIVAAAMAPGADLEGAYRFVENAKISPVEMAAASYRATVARVGQVPYAYVPVDGTSLQIRDVECTKGTGPIGARTFPARGFQVMSALAVTPDGVPQGLCAQSWWSREEKPVTREASKRKVEDKETKYWLEAIKNVRAAFKDSPCTPWLQLDRGGDAWPVLLEAHAPNCWLTVRASYSRRVHSDDDSERDYLWPVVSRSAPLGHYAVEVTAGPNRRARHAVLTVRATEVTLSLRNHQTKVRKPLRIWAVMAKETERSAGNDTPLEWMLLTTFPADTFEAACHVLYGYTQRWRIEEFHRAWKSGACNVEDTQLESERGIRALAVLLASVATRLLRMTYLARTAPNLPASVEFDAAEVRAAALLRGKPRVRVDRVTIGMITLWIAEVGGYINRKSAGPPGLIVLTRGLRSVAATARALRVQKGIGEPELHPRSPDT